MVDVCRVERQIGDKILSIETGKIARQAHGAVMVRYGDTMVLVTAVMAPPRSEDIDFFPLSVDYREKLSAAGKFPGGPSVKAAAGWPGEVHARPLRQDLPDLAGKPPRLANQPTTLVGT